MITFKTIPFGELKIDETSNFEYLEVKTTLHGLEQKISISFSDCPLYNAEIEAAIGNFLNNYCEGNLIAKKAIKAAFPTDKTVSYYFRCHFEFLEEETLLDVFGTNTFDQFHINDTVDGFPAPDMMFTLGDGGIEVSFDYRLKEYSNEILCVIMTKDLNVVGFSHES